MRTGNLLRSQRGGDGGWILARPAETITVADVIRSLEGPLASVRGIRPHELSATGEIEPFVSLWVAVRVALRSVLEHVTIADLAAGALPIRSQRWSPTQTHGTRARRRSEATLDTHTIVRVVYLAIGVSCRCWRLSCSWSEVSPASEATMVGGPTMSGSGEPTRSVFLSG